MKQELLKQNHSSQVDYKLFIHNFEGFRKQHPELSFQQVLDLFFKVKNQDEF